jgi:lipopolysaccharide transport system ATP-binding protein
MSDEVLVQVEGGFQEILRSLKRSLWYDVQDVTSELPGRRSRYDELRKNEFWAVNDVSFELRRGECLGLIELATR